MTGAGGGSLTSQSLTTPSSGAAGSGARAEGGRLPQGLNTEQFRAAADILRSGTAAIVGELAVQGSRVAGTAQPGSDIDFAIRVSPDRFDRLIAERFGIPNPVVRGNAHGNGPSKREKYRLAKQD